MKKINLSLRTWKSCNIMSEEENRFSEIKKRTIFFDVQLSVTGSKPSQVQHLQFFDDYVVCISCPRSLKKIDLRIMSTFSSSRKWNIQNLDSRLKHTLVLFETFFEIWIINELAYIWTRFDEHEYKKIPVYIFTYI